MSAPIRRPSTEADLNRAVLIELCAGELEGRMCAGSGQTLGTAPLADDTVSTRSAQDALGLRCESAK